MKKDDYRSEFEEHRQEISLDEGNSHPSRSELHRKGRKPKKKSGNGTINTILALFTLIPVGILVYVLSDFYTPNNSTSANVVNANTSYEMNKDISEDKTNAGNKDAVVEEDDAEEEEIASVPVEKPEKIETKEEEKNEDQPVEKPKVETETETETESKTDDSVIAKTHTVLPGETLYRISTNYYQSDVGIEKIKNANGLSSNNIMVGQKLIIP